MVSRRNFFTIMTLLGIMIFMFMFVSVIKQEFNEFDINSNGVSEQELNRTMLRENYEELSAKGNPAVSLGGTVLYLSGTKESPVDQVVDGWCRYTKKPYAKWVTLQGIHEQSQELPEVIIINGSDVRIKNEEETLLDLAKKGVCLIFATMPQAKEIDASETLKELMGIDTVYSERVWLDEMHLFEGLFVGGEAIYKGHTGEKNRADKEFLMPWYMLGSGTKTYMMGTVEASDFENQFQPAVLWRNAVGDGKVFCVNAPFMSDMSGIGLLTAFLAENATYDIYPVVNAQNLVLANYGGFSDENTNILMDHYSQKQSQFYRDIVWPALISLNERTGAKISMMISAQMEYDDPELPKDDLLVYYLRLLKENNGEAGISTGRKSETTLAEKLKQDKAYWVSECETYDVYSAFLEDRSELGTLREGFPSVRTVAAMANGGLPVDYADDYVTIQASTSVGMVGTVMEDLSIKGYETALGYSCITVDMSKASYPEGSNYWEDFFKTISSNLSTFWQDFRGFDQTTLGESDTRIRKFLALNYRDKRVEDAIDLHVDGLVDKAYFVLKLNSEMIDDKTELSYRELGNGFYLLEITEEDTVIYVTKKKSLIY